MSLSVRRVLPKLDFSKTNLEAPGRRGDAQARGQWNWPGQPWVQQSCDSRSEVIR